MFHPGGVYEGEKYLDMKDTSFYRSDDRKKEAYTLCRLSRETDNKGADK